MASTSRCVGLSSTRFVCLDHQHRKAAAGRDGQQHFSNVRSFRIPKISKLVHTGEMSQPQSATTPSAAGACGRRRCLRCGQIYTKEKNSPTSCSFHGHMTGDLGMFSLAPPHQGVDGQWTEDSGIIVYRWNQENDRPNTGQKNWKRRWTCCGVYDEHALPCRRGPHVSYDDGFTLF